MPNSIPKIIKKIVIKVVTGKKLFKLAKYEPAVAILAPTPDSAVTSSNNLNGLVRSKTM